MAVCARIGARSPNRLARLVVQFLDNLPTSEHAPLDARGDASVVPHP